MIRMPSVRRLLPALIGVCLLVLLGLALFRGLIIETLAAQVLRSNLGLRATFDGAGGSVLAGIELRGLRARGDGAGPLVELAADRITARYALAALLRGGEAFLDSLEVTVEGAAISLDLMVPVSPPPDPDHPFILPRLPRLSVRESAVRVRGSGYTLEISGLRGATGRVDAAGNQPVDLQADHFSLRHPWLREGSSAVALTGRYSPRLLMVEAAQVNGEPLVENALLAFGERAGEFDLETDLKVWGGAIGIGIARMQEGTQVRWEARGVDLHPQELIALPAFAALRGELTTRGEVRFDGGGWPALKGDLSLRWKGARLAGREVDRLLIQAKAGSGILQVEHAAGRVGPNELELRKVTLPIGPLFDGRWRSLLQEASGFFSSSLGDIPAFLAFWGVRIGKDRSAVPDHQLRLEGSLSGGSIRMTKGDLATGLGKAKLSTVTVNFPRGDQGWGETALIGMASVTFPDLRDLSTIFPLPPLRGSLRGEISATGPILRPEGKVSLTGRGIIIADTPLGDLDLRARGASGWVVIDTLRIRQRENRFAAERVRFAPRTLAPLDRQGLLESLTGSFTLSFSDIAALASLAGVPRETTVRIPSGHILAASGTVLGRTVTIPSGSLIATGGAVTMYEAKVVIPGTGGSWRDTALEGRFAVDIPDLASFATVVPLSLPQPEGALRGQVRVAGTIGEPEGSIKVSGNDLALGGHKIERVRIKAARRGTRVVVEECDIARGADRLQARGGFDLGKKTLLESEAQISLSDVGPYLGEFVRAGIPVSGRLRGSLRARGSLSDAPILVDAEFSDGRLWGLTEVSVAAGTEVLLEKEGRLAVALNSLVISTPGTRFSLEGPAALRRDSAGRIDVRGFALGGADGRIAIKGTLAGHGPSDLRVEVSGLRGGSWFAALAGDRIAFSEADGEVTLRGTPRAPRIAVAARVSQLRGGPGSIPVAAVFAASYEPGTLRLDTCELTGAGGLALNLEGSLPLDHSADDPLCPGRIRLEGRARIPDLGKVAFLFPSEYAVAGGLEATVRGGGSWEDPEARLEFHGERLQPGRDIRFAPPGSATLSGTVTWLGNSVQAALDLVAEPAFTCSLAGTWSGPPTLRALVADRGDALRGTLSLRGSFSSPDVGWLRVSVPGLRKLRGSVAGTISVAGPVRDPTLAGTLRIEEGAIRYRDLPLIDRLTLALSAMNQVVTVTDIHGNVGGSPFTIAGFADLSRRDNPVLDLRLEGRDILLYRDAGLRIRADSTLVLKGPMSGLSFAGEVALANSIYQKNFAVTSFFTGGEQSTKRSTAGIGTFSFPEPPLRDMRFDLRLTAREPLPIRTNIVRGDARPDLRLSGSGALPVLQGPIFFDRTQVLLPSGTLQLERGAVIFRANERDSPLLDFGGRMQIRGYEITVQLGGTLDLPEIILSSVPPLPNDELLLFVLTGAPPGSLEEKGSSFSALASPVAVYLGRNVLEQIFGDWAAAEKIGFQERLELQIGREVTRSGGVTVGSSFRLKEGLLNRDSVLLLTSEKDVYDQYNVGLKVIFRFP